MMSTVERLEVGKLYGRNTKGFNLVVKKLVSLNGAKATYEVVYGKDRGRVLEVNLKTFKKFAEFEVVGDPESYVGLKKRPLVNVVDTTGEKVMTCSLKTAQRYVKNGHFKQLSEDVFEISEDCVLLENLKTAFGPHVLDYLKDTHSVHCNVCGTENNLVRHHILPKRYLKEIRQKNGGLDFNLGITNTLYMCQFCNRKYQEILQKKGEPEDVHDIHSWVRHFLINMEPKFVRNFLLQEKMKENN